MEPKTNSLSVSLPVIGIMPSRFTFLCFYFLLDFHLLHMDTTYSLSLHIARQKPLLFRMRNPRVTRFLLVPLGTQKKRARPLRDGLSPP